MTSPAMEETIAFIKEIVRLTALLGEAEKALVKIEAGMEVQLHTGETVVMDRDDASEIARATLSLLREARK